MYEVPNFCKLRNFISVFKNGNLSEKLPRTKITENLSNKIQNTKNYGTFVYLEQSRKHEAEREFKQDVELMSDVDDNFISLLMEKNKEVTPNGGSVYKLNCSKSKKQKRIVFDVITAYTKEYYLKHVVGIPDSLQPSHSPISDTEEKQLIWTFFKRKWVKCNKCKNNTPVIILRHKDVYCKECFLSGAVHKFKAFIGKNHFIKKNDEVLVCFRSGHPSVSMLHMLRSGLDLQTPKKLKFKPSVIFIAKTKCEPHVLKEVKNVVCSFNFTLYFISLDQYISNCQDLDKILFTNFEQMLENYSAINSFNGIRNNPTVKQTLESIYEQQLLTDVAKHLNCNNVFIPDISVNVATDILTNISLGRGAYLPLDTGICDTRDPQVTIIKPLRHFDNKELAFYNVYNQLQPVVSSNETKMFGSASVQDLMEKFVSNLQTNFPATITTVIRTGDKLALDNIISKNKTCRLCMAPLINNSLEELNSATATDFSRWISTELEIFKKDASFSAFENKCPESCCHACSKIVGFIDK